jgi:hypothetical protein
VHSRRVRVIAGSVTFAGSVLGRRASGSVVMEPQFVGLDVSQVETTVCVVDAAGVALWPGK